MALEVMEQSATKIVASDFLNMKDISIVSLIRKMDVITRYMISDSKLTRTEKHAETIHQRDADVNRLNYLVHRATKYALNNPGIAKAFNMSQPQLLEAYRLAMFIENVADAIKRVSRFLAKIDLEEDARKELISIISDVEKFYLTSMKAYYNDSKEDALIIINEKKKITGRCDDFFIKYHQREWVPSIIENLKNMVVSAHHILRIIFT